MADVSKIQTGGTSYDLKDATARWKTLATLPEKNYATYGALANAIFANISAITNMIDYEYRIVVHVPASSLTQCYRCGRVGASAVTFHFHFTDDSQQIVYNLKAQASGSVFHQLTTTYGSTVVTTDTERTNNGISATSTATWEIQYKHF